MVDTGWLNRLLFGPDQPACESHSQPRTLSSPITSTDTNDTSEKLPSVVVDAVYDSPTSTECQPRHPGEGSAAGSSVWQVRPLAGILGLCVVIAVVLASLFVLVLSDGCPVDDWRIQPTVYLAINAAIANCGLALAYMEAVPCSWYVLRSA
jgi:hypothetical protein